MSIHMLLSKKLILFCHYHSHNPLWSRLYLILGFSFPIISDLILFMGYIKHLHGIKIKTKKLKILF
jgi:hypothetical protein